MTTPVQIILTSGSSWTVPSDWDSANNTVECLGAGGSGGGGGCAYAKKSNIALTAGASVAYHIGTPSTTTATVATWFDTATTVAAAGATGTTGGQASASHGDVRYSGGNGSSNGGGGGAAGPNGIGGNASSLTGGYGDFGFGGAPGAPGDDGSPGTEWGLAGSGGGAGKIGNGGNFGAGGGGSGTGAPGVIVITYTPSAAPVPAPITGSASISIGGAGLLRGVGMLAGVAALAIAGTAAITPIGALSGTASITVGGHGALVDGATPPGAISGTAPVAVGGSGTLTGAGLLRGTAPLAIGGTGALAYRGLLDGTAPIHIGGTGHLTLIGRMHGTATIQIGGVGDLGNAGLDTQFYDLFAQYYTAKQALIDQMLEVARVTGANAQDALAALSGEIDDAAEQAAAANAEIAKVVSDGVLSPAEKKIIIRDANVLFAEQSGIDIQAAAYSVTTQKTAYDAAVNALSSYLGTLNSPVAWDDLTDSTTVNGATFRSKFASVYTTRQTLLNAIYAAAKAKADAAQSTADTAQSLASQVAVLNPGFDAGDTGWTKETGWTIQSDGSFGVGQGYAEHTAVAGDTDAAIRNEAICFVEPGHSYKVAALIRAIGANGYCAARISWRNLAMVEVAFSDGNHVTGNTTTGSYVTGVAPAGAVFARAEVAVYQNTTGTYQVDNVTSTLQPATADEIDESTDRKWAGESGATVGGDWNSNVRNMPQAVGANLMWHGDFASDGSAPDVWSSDGDLGINFPSGTQFAHALSTRGRDAYETNNWFPVKPNEVLFLSGYLAAGSVSLKFGLHFHDKSGNSVWVAGITHSGSWGYESGTVTVPSGYVLAQPWLGQSITAGSNSSTGFAALLDIQRTALAQDGSGYRLGGLRNQVMAGVGNFASGWSGGSITYSASSTSATITAAASTLQIGGTSLSYSQSSTTVSGSAGQTKTYYLYYDDDSYSGGSKSLNATTSQITSLSADGRVLVGTVAVTFPSSGTGSGGGGQTCPDENAWVLRADPDGMRADWCVRAKEVEVGQHLRLTDGRAGKVTYSERKAADRVRVIAESGKALTCSTSAPLELLFQPGLCVPAPESLGRLLFVRFDGARTGAWVHRIEDAGPGYVQHITCQNACFWTGDDPDYLFGHHNMKPPQ